METLTYDLRGVVPLSISTGVRFNCLEIPAYESSPLALVWYTIWDNREEHGARIDLQKQVFLDDFGEIERDKLNAEARLVVNFVSSLSTRKAVVAAMATAGIPGIERLADPRPKT